MFNMIQKNHRHSAVYINKGGQKYTTTIRQNTAEGPFVGMNRAKKLNNIFFSGGNLCDRKIKNCVQSGIQNKVQQIAIYDPL